MNIIFEYAVVCQINALWRLDVLPHWGFHWNHELRKQINQTNNRHHRGWTSKSHIEKWSNREEEHVPQFVAMLPLAPPLLVNRNEMTRPRGEGQGYGIQETMEEAIERLSHQEVKRESMIAEITFIKVCQITFIRVCQITFTRVCFFMVTLSSFFCDQVLKIWTPVLNAQMKLLLITLADYSKSPNRNIRSTTCHQQARLPESKYVKRLRQQHHHHVQNLIGESATLNNRGIY